MRPVRHDPFEAARENEPTAVLAAGTLGSGKTLAAMLLAYIAKQLGALVATLDPKPDHYLYRVPDLSGAVDLIDVTGGEEFRGLLDPLRIAPHNLREDIATSYFAEIVSNHHRVGVWELHIQRAVQEVIRQGRLSSLAVLDALKRSDNQDAREAGEALTTRANSGLGALAFGAQRDGLDSAAKPITTIRTSGLSLPDANTPRQEMSHIERMSVATLKLVATYAMRLVESHIDERGKLLVFDEAWSLLQSADGRQLINRANRLGRRMDTAVILATQTLGDVGEAHNLIGTRFIFGLETAEEARNALTLLGLDPNDEALVQRILSYSEGRCLMRDIRGNVGEVQIDLVYRDLLETLDTKPKRREVNPPEEVVAQ